MFTGTLFTISRFLALCHLYYLGLKDAHVDFEPVNYTTDAEWQPLLLEAAAKLPKYDAVRFDCVQDVIAVVGYIYQKYELNGLGIMRGWDAEHNYHAWLAYATPEGIRYFEPQTLQFSSPGENGYVAETYGIV